MVKRSDEFENGGIAARVYRFTVSVLCFTLLQGRPVGLGHVTNK